MYQNQSFTFRVFRALAIVSICLFLHLQVAAQTPGLIYRPATNGGNKVLDPNGDGYQSKQATGFTGQLDEGEAYSETKFRPLPVMVREPLADLVTGSSGGHTDLAPPSQNQTSNGSPVSAYFDGSNLLFRVRLGNQSSASKGYSFMIDTDGQFGNLVSGRTPSKTPNPGFEFEVVLATNFKVSVYDHRNQPDGGTEIWYGSVDQYSQKGIAGSQDSFKNNDDYFYDFFVPISAFNGGITATTPLRIASITITSAQTGISGTVSDIGGVNFSGSYKGDARNAWKDVIETFPPLTLNEIQKGTFTTQVLAKPPVVSGPIRVGANRISGTSTEAPGSLITVYKNTVVLGTVQVASDQTWTYPVPPSVTLAVGDNIKATVTASGKSVSIFSNIEKVVATSTPICTSTEPPVIGDANGAKKISGTTKYNDNVTIRIYAVGASTPTIEKSVNTSGTSAPYSWTFTIPNSLPAGTYAATIQPATAGYCESLRSNEFCSNGNGAAGTPFEAKPTITQIIYANGTINTTVGPTDISTKLTSISGSLGASAPTVYVYKNGVQQSNFSAVPSTASPYSWTINVSNLALASGDIVTVRASGISSDGSQSCTAVSSPSSAKKAVDILSAPVINDSGNCTNGSTLTVVTGSSKEAPGTKIQLYNAGTGAALGTPATVDNYGSWSVTGLALSSGTQVYAIASATGKTNSAPSNTITVRTPTTNDGLSITTALVEGMTSIEGTGKTSGDIITVYIGGSPYPIPALVSGTTWKLTDIPPMELYPGAEVYVTAKTSSTCESAPSAVKIVACLPPSTNISVKGPTDKVCYNATADIVLETSEKGIIYNLYYGAVRSGASAVGTGGKIILKTGKLTTNPTPITVKATKIGAQDCEPTIATISIGVYDKIPDDYDLTATNLTGCPNTASALTVKAAKGGYTYQVYDITNSKAVGEAIQHQTDGDLTLPEIRIDKSGVYSMLITNTTTGCQTENINSKTITISRTGPDVTLAVRAGSNSVCINGSTDIYFYTQANNNYTYSLINKQTGAMAGTAAVTGNGNERSINTGSLAEGSHTFQVQVSEFGGCKSLFTQEVTVTATNGTIKVSAGPNTTVCNNTPVYLSASNPQPGTGQWTEANTNPTTGVFTSANRTDPNAILQGLQSGTYEFTWTVTNSCSGAASSQSSTVKITVNCSAVGSVKRNDFVDKYVVDEVVAVITDATDGGILSIIKPSVGLPPGTDLVIANNQVFLKVIKAYNPNNPADATALQAGSYTFTTRTTDTKNVSSDVPLTVRMYSRNTAPEPITPLPVELAYFTGVWQNGQVMLNWMTASEKNNEKFVVERSPDGKTFAAIGQVAGQGNSNQQVKYSFLDHSPLAHTIYYRLKQVDFDGVYSYSKTVSVSGKSIAKEVQLQAYPSPFAAELVVAITSEQADAVQVQLIDLQGRRILTQQTTLKAGLNELTLNTQHLQAGLYVLKTVGATIDASAKVVKLH